MNLLNLFGKASVRVRMAPSPTGMLHIGTARTALFNYLFAKKMNGVFVLRIEDTDRERNRPEFEKNIIDGLGWLGIAWDEFYRQSERVDRHTQALEKLIAENKAYVSKEESKARPGERVEVVRLRNTGSIVEFDDMIRGTIKTDTTDLGDFVIARAIDDPLYHLAVVVDDGEMNITHVIRGDDHISNTARQILILEAIGFTRPKYAHVPLILAADRSKMSKRDGATSVDEYKKLGFLPEAVVNYLALMGWNPGTPQEIFTLSELVSAFDVEKFQKGGAIFDLTKFSWYNREHIKNLTGEEFEKRLREFGVAVDPVLVPLLQDRCQTLLEARELIEAGEFSFMHDLSEYPADILLPTVQGEKVSRELATKHLTEVLKLVSAIDASQWSAARVKESVWEYAGREGRGSVLHPMRVSLTGKDRSPDPFTVAGLIGRDRTMRRLERALDTL